MFFVLTLITKFHLFGKLLFTWLSLVMSMMVSFVLSFFPRDVLDEILNLIESVSEDFPSYSIRGSECVVYLRSRCLMPEDSSCSTHDVCEPQNFFFKLTGCANWSEAMVFAHAISIFMCHVSIVLYDKEFQTAIKITCLT